MSTAPIVALAWSDWLNLSAHYLTLSLLSVGGAITTLPEMHRFLVEQQRWLSDAQFNASIAIAQASPGPNVLFVALMGWNVGINAGGMGSALFGALLTMTGILLPSTTLSYMTARWSHRNRHWRSVRAFKQGMSPIVIALLVATGWVLGTGSGEAAQEWRIWLLSGVTALNVWRTRIHLLWLLGAGAVLGIMGWV